jgi:hypothetical protein
MAPLRKVLLQTHLGLKGAFFHVCHQNLPKDYMPGDNDALVCATTVARQAMGP